MPFDDFDAAVASAIPGPPMPAPLGIGFGCLPMLPDALYSSGLLDFVEVTPEIFHREAIVRGRIELVPDRLQFDAARRRCGSLPIVVHGVELSIGSAHGMFEPCLTMMDRLRQEWPFLWYSEHLHFQTLLDHDGAVVNACLLYTSPSPRDGLLSRMPSSA